MASNRDSVNTSTSRGGEPSTGSAPKSLPRGAAVQEASTLITSQLPVKAWHEAIGDPTLADSICDRLIHTAQVIELHGPSMREVRAKAQRGSSSAAAAPASPTSAGSAGKKTT